MLDVEILNPNETENAARIFHRDGFVIIGNALTAEQLATAQSGANRVIAEQMAAIPLDDANRGYARYSFGTQIHHPEWAQLIDNPRVLPILEAIWGSDNFICSGAGGDYSTPGAKIQHLHSDIGDPFNDPLGMITIRDVPAPFIVVNYLMVEFKEINGATRFVPGTHRTRAPIPTLDDEPERMKQSFICAPAGTAIVRDVRCWHGGTPNTSDEIRPMFGVGYFAPWFRDARLHPTLPRSLYDTLSERGKRLARFIVAD
jgi:hypothetical protein